ncbi:MAG: extracellular solute-binding protein, partial [Sphaerochaetaceae bacterium]
MKRFIVILLVLVVLTGVVFAEGVKEATPAQQGKVFNIYCWNEEFQTRFNDYFEAAGLVPDDVTVNWIITPNADNAYQNKLDEALLAQKDASNDDKVDIFLVEADYALKYVNTNYALDVINDVGLTDADVSNMYQYTKDIMTSSDGKLKGLSWQSCPGGFIYRRSIAKDVLGTDDPAEVQMALDSWDKFDATAKAAKAKGYFMLSGYDDAFRVFSDNAKTPWVDENGKISISDSIEEWITQTKTYTDMGYNNKANLWSAESWSGAALDGKVFGYFGPGWFIDFSLAPACLADAEGPKELGNGSYGDWGLCKGPQGFSWGGTWICVAEGTDNIELAKSLLYTMTCDKDTLVAIAQDMGDFTNNV